jgi:hypothetical protein
MSECRDKTCGKLCIKEEIGEDSSKWGGIFFIYQINIFYYFLGWSKIFSRAPAASNDCLEACFYGCSNKMSSDDSKV